MTDTDMEARLRRTLADRAEGADPLDAPYDRIVQRGRRARQRGRIALGAGAAVLVAVPGLAIGAQGSWLQEDGAPAVAVATGGDTGGDTGGPDPAGVPAGPADPERQLLDGITLEQARASLANCLSGPSNSVTVNATEGAEGAEPGAALDLSLDLGELRIVLAWESEGDEYHGPEPTRQVLAVSAAPAADSAVQLVCGDRGDGSSAADVLTGGPPELTDPVVRDVNADRHYGPGQRTPPFRWVDFGMVGPEVERVTVEYAGATEEAVLDAGYFVVAGLAQEQPSGQPVIKGYGADGALLFDSGEDPQAAP
jgi:hypothetical protein